VASFSSNVFITAVLLYRQVWFRNYVFSPKEGGKINRPTAGHLHHCTQHGQQTEGPGSHYEAVNL